MRPKWCCLRPGNERRCGWSDFFQFLKLWIRIEGQKCSCQLVLEILKTNSPPLWLKINLFYIYSVIFQKVTQRFGCMKSLLASQRVCLSFGNPLKPGGTNSLFLFVSLTQRAVLCSESCCVCTSVALNATMVLSSKNPPTHYQLFYSRQQS